MWLKGVLWTYPHTYPDWANLLFHIGVQGYVSGLESELYGQRVSCVRLSSIVLWEVCSLTHTECLTLTTWWGGAGMYWFKILKICGASHLQILEYLHLPYIEYLHIFNFLNIWISMSIIRILNIMFSCSIYWISAHIQFPEYLDIYLYYKNT